MTDPGTADRTYIGPMTPELVEEIIANERPDAVLPTMGGQTGLNLAKALSESGILDKCVFLELLFDFLVIFFSQKRREVAILPLMNAFSSPFPFCRTRFFVFFFFF